MKRKKLGLFPRVLIAMALGVALGFVLPMCGVRVLKTFNALFAQFLKFIVPLLILGLVIPALADVGKGAGKMLLVIMGLSYASTVAAGFWGFGMSQVLFPHYLPTGAHILSSVQEVKPYFALKIPPLCDTLTALCLAFMTGIAIARLGCERLRGACDDFGEVVKFTIVHVVIPLIPIYILTMVAELAASGKIVALGVTLLKIIATGIGLTVTYLIVLFCVTGLLVRRNPLKMLKIMLPAYLTGLSISSSTAVIPVTLDCVEKNGVSSDVAQLTVPLCANVHLVGAMIKVVMNSAAVMWIFGLPIDVMTFAQFIFMVGIMAVAAPGVTGGTLMASLGVMDSILGLTPEQTALVMTCYLAFDGYGPAANVTGDGAIAILVDHWFGKVPALAKRAVVPCVLAAFCILPLRGSALEVYLLRHGETTWNRAKVLQGTTPYTRLTEKGAAMATETGRGMKAAGLSFDRVYASPLVRTRQTADLVCRPLGLADVVPDARLREMDLGDHQGIRYDAATCTNESLRMFYTDITRYRPHGATAETFDRLTARALDFLEKELKPLDGKCDRVLCVTHLLFLKALLKTFPEEAVPVEVRKGQVRNCGVVVLELKDGRFVLKEAGRVFYDVARFEAMKTPRIVAHRGACDLEMEEATRAAYSNAVQRAVDIVKLDVQETRDGVIVLGHDESLNRNMGWNTHIFERDYAEICAKGRFKAKPGYPEETIVRLEEALEIVRPIPEIWIDFKAFSYAFVERVLETVRRAGIDESRIMIATFNVPALEYVQYYHPSVRRVAHIAFGKAKDGHLTFQGQPADDPVAALLAFRKRLGLYGMNLPVGRSAAHRMTADEISALGKAGVWRSLWFVQDAELAREYWTAGADAFVTDHGSLVRSGGR